jgi:two-component system, LuxR family, response regulator FixJ
MGPNTTVYVIDDEEAIRKFVQTAFTTPTCDVKCFPSADHFLNEYDDSGETPRCLILDVRLPGMGGLELHRILVESGSLLPVILLTGAADVPSAVESIQRGAVDFLQKPVSRKALFEIVERGLAIDSERRIARREQRAFQNKLGLLSRREREVFELLKDCKTNKQIAAILEVGFPTAAKHRSNVFKKLNVANEFEFMQLVDHAAQLATVEDAAHGSGEFHTGERLAEQR